MPVKAVPSTNKVHSSRMNRFVSSARRRTKLAAIVVLFVILGVMLRPALQRAIHTDLSKSDTQPLSSSSSASRVGASSEKPRDAATKPRGGDGNDTVEEEEEEEEDGGGGKSDHANKVVELPGAPGEDWGRRATSRDAVAAEDHGGDGGDAAVDDDAGANDDDAAADGDSAAGTAPLPNGPSAKIVTCPACRLNALPEVKRFVHELAKHFEPQLKVDFQIGEDPVLHLFLDGQKTESIALDKYTTKDVILRLGRHGLEPKPDNGEINKVMQELDKADA